MSERSQPVGSDPSQLSHPPSHDWIWQLPPGHVGVAFAREHTTPQPLQLETVAKSVSQPLPAPPLQSPRSVSHDAISHVPLPHVPVANAGSQTTPQPPQSDVRFSRSSHPSPSLPLQFPYPELQDSIRHENVPQVALAFVREHPAPHAPQFDSVSRGVSQPFESIPSQSSQPLLQPATRQTPASQLAVACGRLHTFPHSPQLFVSVPRIGMHTAPQHICPAPHAGVAPQAHASAVQPSANGCVGPRSRLQSVSQLPQ